MLHKLSTMFRLRQIAQLIVVGGLNRRNHPILAKKLCSQLLEDRKKKFGTGGLFLCSAFVVHAFGFRKGMDFSALDNLFDDAKYQDVIDALEPKREEGNDEILWRLARAKFQRSKTLSDAEKKAMLHDAYAIIQKSLQINDKNWANHKWTGILLDAVSQLEGTKERITQSLNVKSSIMKALELYPDDASCYHVLGVWCFSFADLPWIQRQVASVVFAKPPTSTYEEALKYFEKGEEVNPGWYTTNMVMLGKCHMRLNNKDKAIECLKKAKEKTIINEDDRVANKDAIELLASLGVKS